MEQILTPKQVAQALQVSESSIKRWCDRGVIESHKTGGGHRRISIGSLMAFLQETNRRVIDPLAIGMTAERQVEMLMSAKILGGNSAFSADELSRRQVFEDALIRGDERECRRILIYWYSVRESFAAVADELISTTFRSIGESWHRGEIEIFQERRACEIASRLVQEFRRLILDPFPNAPKAIGGSASGDYYAIPSQLVEVSMLEAGWQATNLGTNLPFETILEAARSELPEIIWLSVSHFEDEYIFVNQVNELASLLPQSTRLVIGGRMLSKDLAKKLPFSTYCNSMLQLSQLADDLLRNGKQRAVSS